MNGFQSRFPLCQNYLILIQQSPSGQFTDLFRVRNSLVLCVLKVNTSNLTSRILVLSLDCFLPYFLLSLRMECQHQPIP